MFPDGDTLTHYVYADKGHVPSYMIRGLNKYKIVTNAQGSVRFVVNESTGVIEQEMTYDEFGQVLSDSNPGFQAFGFAGGIYESDTGLVRFGARDYDAEVGRWISKDPILFGGGDTNRYGYVLQDPINFIDPYGLSAWNPITFVDQAKRGAGYLLHEFHQMNKANVPGVDKFYHCMSHCKAAGEGPGGWAMSMLRGYGKEAKDIFKYGAKDCQEDLNANSQGRNNNQNDCLNSCKSLMPSGFAPMSFK